MPQIRNFEIIKPPTSDEVGRLAMAAFRDNQPLCVTIQEAATDLKPEGEISDISITVSALQRAHDEILRVRGQLPNEETILLTVNAEPTVPATLSVVTA